KRHVEEQCKRGQRVERSLKNSQGGERGGATARAPCLGCPGISGSSTDSPSGRTGVQDHVAAGFCAPHFRAKKSRTLSPNVIRSKHSPDLLGDGFTHN